MKDILGRLNIAYNGGPFGWGWGFLLYLIIFLAVLTLLLQKKSNLLITIFMAITVMAALLDKIGAFPTRDFWAFFDRVMMLVFPLVVGGMTRTPRSRPWAILGGIVAGVYLFARWFLDQMPH
jgi:hypothetical protein